MPESYYYISQIVEFAFGFTPRGFIPCNGQLLAIREHEPLYALLGTTYGGDGRHTFALPDLRGKTSSEHLHYCICAIGILPQRKK